MRRSNVDRRVKVGDDTVVVVGGGWCNGYKS